MFRGIVSYCAIGLLMSLFVGGVVHVSLREPPLNEEMVLEEEVQKIAPPAIAISEPPPAPTVEGAAAPVLTEPVVIEASPPSAPIVEVVTVPLLAEPIVAAPVPADPAVIEASPPSAPIVGVATAPLPAEPIVAAPVPAEPVLAEVSPPAAPIVVAQPAAAPQENEVVIGAKVKEAPPMAEEKRDSSGGSCAPVCDKPCQLPVKKMVKPCTPKVCKPCGNPPPACCWKFNPCNPKGCTDMNCGGVFLSADFLYWSKEAQGFTYAYKVKSATNAGIGKMVRLDSSWDPGFRLGLGWNTPYNFWDLSLNYTWYQNQASKTSTNTLGFINMWPVSSAASGEFSTVSASARLKMNMVDLELGRLIYLTKYIALRPKAGVKGGTLNQKFENHFDGRLAGEATNNQLKFDGQNNFWGCGPRLGVDGEWHLSSGFSLLGQFTGALLYGGTDAKSLSTRLPIGSSAFVTNREYKNHFNQLVPNLQLSLGFQWQTCFWSQKMFYKMSLSWEANYWWNQFNLPVATSSSAPIPNTGNQSLTMEGATYNMEWSF